MSGKKMNIYDEPEFSEGASYVVMCYNSYGMVQSRDRKRIWRI